MVRAFRAAVLLLAWICAGAELPRARWLSNGMIDAGGSHEPLIFTRRAGGSPNGSKERYNDAQSEEVIRRLKSQGVEVFHTHLYKGFGMKAEAPEMEDARRVAAICHRLGLRVDSYIQWNSLMYETFFAEEPRARDWVQRDAAGQPILLTYGFEQAWRYRPCFSNPSYLEYLKRVVRYAVEQVKTDFIHFDNFDLNPEPESCHCGYCIRAFRKFLKDKYPVSKRRERFGFENLDHIEPPVWNRGNAPEKLQAIRDPVIQEWIAYRCYEMSEALRSVAEYARSFKRDVAIEVNPHGITGGNRAWEAGLDHAQFLRWTDAFWTEEPNDPGLEPDGRLITRIRSYKLARAFKNILLSYVSGNQVALAEALAFNQTIGFAGEDPLDPETIRYIEFYRRHRDLYAGTEDDSTVAVLRSHASIANHNARAQLGAVLAEQALIQGHVSFRLIFDDDLRNLGRYKVLVLPDSECLSDEQLDQIRRFVSEGGGLVATGPSGQYDQWLRPRTRPGLADLLPSQKPGTAYGEEAHWTEDEGPTTKTEFQKGRAAYLPGIQFDGAVPAARPYFTIDNAFWKKPRNSGQLLEAVNWAAPDALPVTISGPEYVALNVVSQTARRRTVVHLVNYKSNEAIKIPLIDVALQIPGGLGPPTVIRYSPEAADGELLAVEMKSNKAHVMVRDLRTYCVIEVAWP